jgi:hypothetical protein
MNCSHTFPTPRLQRGERRVPALRAFDFRYRLAHALNGRLRTPTESVAPEGGTNPQGLSGADALRSLNGFSHPAVTVSPERAGRTRAAQRVVFAFFMGTADDPVNSGYRTHRLEAKELDDFTIDNRVEPNVRLCREPTPELGRLFAFARMIPTATLLAR